MALSYFAESEAPRDFRVSSTESDGHYKKCLLCYTVKKNFYCPDCIRAGNFVSSSMPYSDRFAEKQAKLLRLKANRCYVLDRCEKLLAPKIKRDTLLTEVKQSQDKIDLLRLAIEQRRKNIEEKKRQLTELAQHNNVLRWKTQKYKKKVVEFGTFNQKTRISLQNIVSKYGDQAQSLAMLRRSRIRQLTKYIFPVYVTYDSSDSIEDMEFVGEDAEELPKRSQLHIAAPWVYADGDVSHLQAWEAQSKSGESALSSSGAHRSAAALALAAQLVSLVAATLDARLPCSLSLSEYCTWRVCAGGAASRTRRLCACAGALCARAGLPPPAARAPLHTVAALCTAAASDAPELGRVEAWWSGAAADAWAEWCEEHAGVGAEAEADDCEPEHLHWPETLELEELSCTPPPAPAPSLVTSVAASVASIWRGWTK